MWYRYVYLFCGYLFFVALWISLQLGLDKGHIRGAALRSPAEEKLNF